MAKIFISSILFFFIFFQTTAQSYQLKGRVVDSETLESLAFVNIQNNKGPDGCITDIDGKFLLQSRLPIATIKASYVGYLPAEITIESGRDEYVIRLYKTSIELPEVAIKPGINPADRIIATVVENRYMNDHERLESFQYTSYEKMVFGPENDSIPQVDSLMNDSSYINARDFFKKQHLFLMETINKRRFRFPNDNYTEVIASRVSGLSDPLFVFLMSGLQSTSFYKEAITISDRNYINPISNGSSRKYYFEIQDTLIEPYPYDTTFIISFRPLLKSNFDGLKGLLYISSNGYAIRNVIASPARNEGNLDIKIQQLYSFVDSTHWFPSQLNTDLIIKNVAVAVDSLSIKVVGRGKSYITSVVLNPPFNRSQFGFVETEILPNATKFADEKWDLYRAEPLTQRELNTYHIIDSIGKAQNLDRLTKRIEALLYGKINLNYVDLYLNDFFALNKHEGYRVGLHLSTSEKLNRFIQVGGYTAYGFKDKEFKYGANAKLTLNRLYNTKLDFSYINDVNEAGANDIFDSYQSKLNIVNFRSFQVNKMDAIQSLNYSIGSRIFKYVTLSGGFAIYTKQPLYDYKYKVAQEGQLEVTSSKFRFAESNFVLRYAYGEKVIKNAKSVLPVPSTFPVLLIGYTHGFNQITGGEYEYNRLDLKFDASKNFKFFGTTSLQLKAAWLDRDVPYVNLFSIDAAYRNFVPLSTNSFQTMRYNEFAADKFVTWSLMHNFGKLLFRSKHFNPEPILVFTSGYGSLRKPENHVNVSTKSFEKGYHESGLIVNNLLSIGPLKLGIGSFYRIGPYRFYAEHKNFAYKLSIDFSL